VKSIEVGVELDKQAEKVGLLGAVKNFFKHYATFSGRSSRSEYWYVQISGFLIYLALVAVSVAVDTVGLDLSFVGVLGLGAGLALIVPNFAIMSRRLRDAGISPYFLFFIFLPILGGLALIVMMMFPSKEPANPSE
jgi:uncharacterized membrane protein YhaH (DUF805 family)